MSFDVVALGSLLWAAAALALLSAIDALHRRRAQAASRLRLSAALALPLLLLEAARAAFVAAAARPSGLRGQSVPSPTSLLLDSGPIHTLVGPAIVFGVLALLVRCLRRYRNPTGGAPADDAAAALDSASRASNPIAGLPRSFAIVVCIAAAVVVGGDLAVPDELVEEDATLTDVTPSRLSWPFPSAAVRCLAELGVVGGLFGLSVYGARPASRGKARGAVRAVAFGGSLLLASSAWVAVDLRERFPDAGTSGFWFAVGWTLLAVGAFAWNAPSRARESDETVSRVPA